MIYITIVLIQVFGGNRLCLHLQYTKKSIPPYFLYPNVGFTDRKQNRKQKGQRSFVQSKKFTKIRFESSSDGQEAENRELNFPLD